MAISDKAPVTTSNVKGKGSLLPKFIDVTIGDQSVTMKELSWKKFKKVNCLIVEGIGEIGSAWGSGGMRAAIAATGTGTEQDNEVAGKALSVILNAIQKRLTEIIALSTGMAEEKIDDEMTPTQASIIAQVVWDLNYSDAGKNFKGLLTNLQTLNLSR